MSGAAGFDLGAAASGEMVRNGFHVGLPEGWEAEVAAIRERLAASATMAGSVGKAAGSRGKELGDALKARDLRSLEWSSIDNDTSRDLDQIEEASRVGAVADRVSAGIRVQVAIADVAAAVVRGGVLDQAASQQGQTVYTAVKIFPMLPVELSTDLTSLNEDGDRSALVVAFTVGMDGGVSDEDVYEAQVRNKAQLAYPGVGAWLEGGAAAPAKVTRSAELERQIRLQDEAAAALHGRRVKAGAIEFDRLEAGAVVIDGQVKGIEAEGRSRATTLIEELMIASNEVMARRMKAAGRSSIRRVVRAPERWQRIVEVAATLGEKLTDAPDSGALNRFLEGQKTKDAVHYPDLALAVIKLMGPGEYVVSGGAGAGVGAGARDEGHFGLAAQEYAHSTAPNRRFADVVTQRIVKAMLAGEAAPYTDEELAGIAQRSNEREAAARKVERAMEKRVAAVALEGRVGQTFHGVVTGAAAKGVWVRVFDPPVEGRVVAGEQGLDVGDRVDVVLAAADPVRGFIDFRRV